MLIVFFSLRRRNCYGCQNNINLYWFVESSGLKRISGVTAVYAATCKDGKADSQMHCGEHTP
jgi:hypothetical protein